jgi:hypothetical protein
MQDLALPIGQSSYVFHGAPGSLMVLAFSGSGILSNLTDRMQPSS